MEGENVNFRYVVERSYIDAGENLRGVIESDELGIDDRTQSKTFTSSWKRFVRLEVTRTIMNCIYNTKVMTASTDLHIIPSYHHNRIIQWLLRKHEKYLIISIHKTWNLLQQKYQHWESGLNFLLMFPILRLTFDTVVKPYGIVLYWIINLSINVVWKKRGAIEFFTTKIWVIMSE